MSNEIAKHPSDIAQSAIKYLKTVDVPERTMRIYIEVLLLFIDSLLSDPSAVTEGEDGEFLLCNNWDAYYGGAFSNFIDWWMARKVMGGDTLQARAPGILRKWIKWCYENHYFEKERYEDFLEALPRGKSKEVKRLQKAGNLLYSLHTPNPGAWMTRDYNKVVPITQRKEPEEWDEGYMRIIRLEKDSVYLETEEGSTVGPVMLSRELVKVLRLGDVMNVAVGRFGKRWTVLESGNVYADGTIF